MRPNPLNYLILISLVLLTGCGPLRKFTRAQSKVDKTKAELAANREEQNAIGRNFVYGAHQALAADPEPSKQSQVAEQLTERALLATGLPPAAEAAEFRQLAQDLVSTNATDQARGAKSLAAHDSALAAAQSRADGLQDKLQVTEAKLREVSADNAALAAKWVRLRHLVEWIIGGCAAVILFLIALQVLPIFFPELSVARSTLSRVVSSVQSIRDRLQTESPETAAAVDQTLSVAIPPNSKHASLIKRIKADLGL